MKLVVRTNRATSSVSFTLPAAVDAGAAIVRLLHRVVTPPWVKTGFGEVSPKPFFTQGSVTTLRESGVRVQASERVKLTVLAEAISSIRQK